MTHQTLVLEVIGFELSESSSLRIFGQYFDSDRNGAA